MPVARQLTFAPHDHVLTNCNVFSPDGEWIVYDVRSKQGTVFDGSRIERVRIADGRVEVIYQSRNNASCGVATYASTRERVVFIVGPEHPTPDFAYGAMRRKGVVVDTASLAAHDLDARDLSPPFTVGALRGGTHVHVFNHDDSLVSFTYEDHVLDQLGNSGPHERNRRTVGISITGRRAAVSRTHPRNHDGAFSVLVVETKDQPVPGSDQIARAVEEAWVGTRGYVKSDGSHQRHALAFQGSVMTGAGQLIPELFIVDLPEEIRNAGKAPLQGTPTTMPGVPAGCSQRRLTRTADRPFPGIQGPRHWTQSSPDGSRIAFLMKDDAGVVQIHTISPNGGEPSQVTRNEFPIASSFTWSPCGRFIAHAMDGSVCLTRIADGSTMRLTRGVTPRPEACVFSPDGKWAAFVSPVDGFDQVFLVDCEA